MHHDYLQIVRCFHRPISCKQTSTSSIRSADFTYLLHLVTIAVSPLLTAMIGSIHGADRHTPNDRTEQRVPPNRSLTSHFTCWDDIHVVPSSWTTNSPHVCASLSSAQFVHTSNKHNTGKHTHNGGIFTSLAC